MDDAVCQGITRRIFCDPGDCKIFRVAEGPELRERTRLLPWLSDHPCAPSRECRHQFNDETMYWWTVRLPVAAVCVKNMSSVFASVLSKPVPTAGAEFHGSMAVNTPLGAVAGTPRMSSHVHDPWPMSVVSVPLPMARQVRN